MGVISRTLCMYRVAICKIRELWNRIRTALLGFCHFRVVSIAAVGAILCCASVFLLYTFRSKVSLTVSDIFLALGFSVKEIVIRGNSALTNEQILGVIEDKKSIVVLPLNELCERIKKQSPWIKKVSISRVISSGVLSINIVEYEAFANWYRDGINSIIDDTGYVILDRERRYENLVSIHGKNAVKNLAFIKQILGSGEELSTMISSFVFADDDEWSIGFSSGLQVKFSKQDSDVVWSKLVNLYNTSSDLLVWGVIDMDTLNGVDKKTKALR